MNDEQATLYARIDAFPIDDPEAAFPFTERLARENGWSLSHATHVVEEYKKFTFLAIVAGHPVTPSDAVDQAWHMHLTYSRSYWEEFCPHALGLPLHHHPTRGSVEEGERFFRDYTRTLESYQRLFGETPPPDIWPKPDERFGDDSCHRRVNTARASVIPKPSLAVLLLGVAGLVLGVALIFVAGEIAKHIKPETVHGILDMPGKEFLAFFVILFGVGALMAAGIRLGFRQPPGNLPPEVNNLSIYNTAYLAGGKDAVFSAALAALVSRGEVTVDAATQTLTRGRGAGDGSALHIVERNLLKALDQMKPTPVQRALDRFVLPSAIPLRLEELGQIVPERQALLGRVVPVAFLIPVLVLGCIKLAIGLSRGHPVGGLVFLCLVAAGIIIGVFGASIHRTPRGDRQLAELRSEHTDLKPEGSKKGQPVATDDMALAVALFGIAVLSVGPLSSLYELLKPLVAQSSHVGDWSGGGCGDGGGCGGGCGGCG